MTVSYLGFLAKYPQFADVLEPQFTALLPAAIADVSFYNWQLLGSNAVTFQDRAVEALIGCRLSQVIQDYKSVNEFEIKEAGYRVKYNPIPDSWFCNEYQRLIKFISQLMPGQPLRAATCGIPTSVVWSSGGNSRPDYYNVPIIPAPFL